MTDHTSKLAPILRRQEARVLADWMSDLTKAGKSGATDKSPSSC